MAKELTTQVSAPGRVVLFGEHGLEFGEPAIAVAVEMRALCSAQVSSRFMVNGQDLDQKRHAYARSAMLNGWTDMDRPIALRMESRIPAELDLGGLAAETVACLGAISMLHDHIIFEHVARNAFLTHCEVDGGCIPLDISASTHGGCIMLSQEESAARLWTFKGRERAWHAHVVELPEMEIVLGYTGSPSPALDMRQKVLRFAQRNAFARDIIRDIGRVSREGHAALLKGDIEEAGRSMNRNQRLLANLGVGNQALEKLVQAASRHSHGAKITGPGGGGCVVALARDPEKVSDAIEAAGGKPHRVTVARDGLRPED